MPGARAQRDRRLSQLAGKPAEPAGRGAWWVGLSHLIGRFRHLLTEGRLRMINQIPGLMLSGFGVLLLGEVIMKRIALLM